MPDVAARIHFLPRQDRAGFVRFAAAADVLLDPIHFGGGNTSYEALAVGTPVITLPSPYLRGRITHALYRQMDVLDCVVGNAQEYVERAVCIAADPQARSDIRRQILSRNDVLFGNMSGVRDLERFLLAAVQSVPHSQPI
jgi:predicted O-linked N-acetylglucosamine transferase (SPINDLY family)